jgi:thiamine-phosphate pyrophosphorylase
VKAVKLRGYYAILDVVDVTPNQAGGLGGRDRALDDQAFEQTVLRASRLLAAGPCMLQIRAKALRAADIATLARAVLPLARAAGVPLCVNDRLDVALAVSAEAVHLGQEDLPLTEARRVAGAATANLQNRTGQALLIGVSTHNPAQAQAAVAAGADYIAFGPVFATTTKARPDATVGIDWLRQIATTATVPVVAIGGIPIDRAAEIAATGAAAAALIAAIDQAANPVAAGQAVNAAFARR